MNDSQDPQGYDALSIVCVVMLVLGLAVMIWGGLGQIQG